MADTSLRSSTLIQNTNNSSIKNTIQSNANNANNTSLINNNNNLNNGNNGNANTNGPKHHFRHHNLISHNQFIKQDVKEVSLLDSLKSNIIDDSPIRKANYIPEMVYVRTNLCLLTGDQQNLKGKGKKK